ncbi:MAG: PAS domain S-box protein [Candidatus Krumholzibacteriia bacterium]
MPPVDPSCPDLAAELGFARRLDQLERQNAELRQKLRINQCLCTATGDLIFVHPLEAAGQAPVFASVNDEACRRLGYAREELLRMRPQDIIAEADLDDVEEEVRALQADGELQFLKTLVGRSGQRIPVEIRSRTFEDAGRVMAVSIARDITEREIQRRQLAEQESRLRLLTDNLPAQMAYVDRDQVYRFVNARYSERFGVPVASIVGRRVCEVLGESVYAEFKPSIERALAGEFAQQRARTPSCADGTPRWVDARFVPDIVAGEVRGYYVLVLDVHDHVVASEALARQERVVEDFVQRAPVGIAVCDAQGAIQRANPAFETLLGYGPDELTGLRASDITHPDDRAGDLALCGRVVSGACEVASCRKRYLHRDGGIVWADLTVSMADREAGLWFGVVRDVTGEVGESFQQQRLLTAIEQSDDSIVITAPDGTIEYVNAAFTRHTGYRADEVLGRNPRLLKSGAQDHAFYAEIWRTLLAGESWSGQLVNRRRDGSMFTEAASITPVRDAQGRTVNYVAVKRDITHEQELERDIRQAQKMEAIGQLAAGIAHDFNNVVYAIMGNTELALTRLPDDHDAGGFLRDSLTACLRARDLVGRILAFSRRQDAGREQTDLNQVVGEVLDLLRSALPSTVDLVAEIDPACPPILADGTDVHQILMNLCSNAVQAMPGGKGRLVVGLDVDPASAGAWIRLRVADDGAGMTPEVARRCFEPYFTTKGVGEGTGMGLSIVHGLVTGLGGTLAVDTAPGRGTAIAIRLPAAAVDHTAAAPPAPPRPAPGTRAGRLMVVEDEPSVLRLETSALAQAGYQVSPFGDPAAALAAFAADPGGFDLVLTDQTMPGATGVDLARAIHDLRADLPIILCSGYGPDRSTAALQALGIRRRLAKPVALDDLVAAVASSLGDRAGAASPPDRVRS